MSTRAKSLIGIYKRDGVLLLRNCSLNINRAELRIGVSKLKSSISDKNNFRREKRFVVGPLPQELENLWRSDYLISCARSVMNTENIALYMNRILVKDAAWHEQVQVHQDMPYFHGGSKKVSFFLALTSQSPRTTGGLVFLKGSHHYGQIQRGTVVLEHFTPLQEFAPDLHTGDLVVADFLNWHYSPRSTLPSTRIILQIVYQPADDGSYGGFELGVPEPTLVCGVWQTSYFSCHGRITFPDS